MLNANKKNTASLIALILIVTMAIPLVSLPVQAHNPSWVNPTWCYCVVVNNVIGIGQPEKIIFWVNSMPPTANGQYGDRWKYTIDIMKPDGTNETLGPLVSDPVGSGYTIYTPDRSWQLHCCSKVPNHNTYG